jgi:hypothetical protein
MLENPQKYQPICYRYCCVPENHLSPLIIICHKIYRTILVIAWLLSEKSYMIFVHLSRSFFSNYYLQMQTVSIKQFFLVYEWFNIWAIFREEVLMLYFTIISLACNYHSILLVDWARCSQSWSHIQNVWIYSYYIWSFYFSIKNKIQILLHEESKLWKYETL